MNLPTLSKIDEIRKKGFRAQVVGCFFNKQKKVFMFYDEKYQLWQFPQGGIENKETAKKALAREMTEELGTGFISKSDLKNCILLGENSIKFPAKFENSRELEDDSGKNIKMQGKWYYFFAVETKVDSFADYLADSQFQDWKLLNHAQASSLAETIYQKGKRRITLLGLNFLQESELIE